MVFANQVELKNHTRQDHEIEHSIEQSSNDEAEYNRADASASESESSLRCEICGITESTNESLSNHVALHENQLKCVVCGTVLKHRSNLILHMRIHVSHYMVLLTKFNFFFQRILTKMFVLTNRFV